VDAGGRRGDLTRARGVGSGFGKWMQTSYGDAFTSAVKGKKGFTFGTYDHVYIDVNNVLHVAAHHTKNEDAFFKKLFALLDLNMRRTRPQYTVTLALDGPAPIAKTITQRRRRIRLSSGEKVPLSEDPPRLLKIGLTPGSTLALKIDRALEYYAATRLLSRNSLPRGLLFEISGTRVPGEGEVKILRSMKMRVDNPKFAGHSHIIVSEDSDALLLAMTAAPADTFVLSSKLIFSVRSFNEQLARELPLGVELEGARRDFVALAVMMGNDYLPGSRFGVKYSWRAYVQLRSGEKPKEWLREDGEKSEGTRRGETNDDATASLASVCPSPSSDVEWGKYRAAALFPAPEASDASTPRRSGRGTPWMKGLSAAVYEEGKMAFRHPPPVNWKMLNDFSKVLGDPEYVRWQVSDGLRPRADVQRAVNAAAASFANPNTSARGAPANDDEDDGAIAGVLDILGDGAANGDADDDADDPPQRAREIAFSTIPGVAGVVRAKLDPVRSARRAYEYIHGVGWVLEMYYSGACLDYGYHFQYSSKEHNQGIAATIPGGVNAELVDAADAAATEAAAAVAAAAAAATATGPGAGPARDERANSSAGASASSASAASKPPHLGGRTTIPPPAVDLADFQNLPLSYDPTLDPLRDRERATIAYLNRFPITPLAYSLAVIPRGGRAMLARGVRPLVDQGSPVHHLFVDDYCVTCIKHRIAAGPLERVIQEESSGGADGQGGGAGARGGGRGSRRRGRGGRGGGRGARSDDATDPNARSLSRKFAGGDEAIRDAARAGGDVAREVLRKLNRRHLDHLARAPQHREDKPPPPLNDLEGAVARVSLDGLLSEDEETLRTLGDQPVLIWHRESSDPPDVDLRADLTGEEDIPAWASAVAPPGCRPVGRQMHEIRRYDGDAAPVLTRWAVGGEKPAVSSGPGGGRGRGGGGSAGARRRRGKKPAKDAAAEDDDPVAPASVRARAGRPSDDPDASKNAAAAAAAVARRWKKPAPRADAPGGVGGVGGDGGGAATPVRGRRRGGLGPRPPARGRGGASNALAVIRVAATRAFASASSFRA
jgi:hypothetical protein